MLHSNTPLFIIQLANISFPPIKTPKVFEPLKLILVFGFILNFQMLESNFKSNIFDTSINI